MLSKQEEQAERRDIIENEKRLRGSTLSQFAQSDAAEARGRFSAISNPTVIGTETTPKYPQGPAWCADPTGVEPPLGVDINAMEPVGEPHELKASIAQLGPDLQQALGDPTAAPSNSSRLMSKRVGSPPSYRRRISSLRSF
jgi:hypothetical protein